MRSCLGSLACCSMWETPHRITENGASESPPGLYGFFRFFFAFMGTFHPCSPALISCIISSLCCCFSSYAYLPSVRGYLFPDMVVGNGIA